MGTMRGSLPSTAAECHLPVADSRLPPGSQWGVLPALALIGSGSLVLLAEFQRRPSSEVPNGFAGLRFLTTGIRIFVYVMQHYSSMLQPDAHMPRPSPLPFTIIEPLRD